MIDATRILDTAVLTNHSSPSNGRAAPEARAAFGAWDFHPPQYCFGGRVLQLFRVQCNREICERISLLLRFRIVDVFFR